MIEDPPESPKNVSEGTHAYFHAALDTMRERVSPAGRDRIDETPTFLAELRILMYTLAGKDVETLVGIPPSLDEILQGLDKEELQKVQFSDEFVKGLAALISRYSGEELQS